MRVNVYAEELSDRVPEIVSKQADGHTFAGVRFYLELPVTIGTSGGSIRGPFIHRENDDDSAAVTFWSLKKARKMFSDAIDAIDSYTLSHCREPE